MNMIYRRAITNTGYHSTHNAGMKIENKDIYERAKKNNTPTVKFFGTHCRILALSMNTFSVQ